MSLPHLHCGFFFATSTLPPVFAHHEDLHQLGVGHQLVFKGGKNLVYFLQNANNLNFKLFF